MMNDNEKYIEEFVKDIPFDAPDSGHRDKLKRQLLNAFPKHRLQPTEPSVQTWRIIMNSKITKLVAWRSKEAKKASKKFPAHLNRTRFDAGSGH